VDTSRNHTINQWRSQDFSMGGFGWAQRAESPAAGGK